MGFLPIKDENGERRQVSDRGVPGCAGLPRSWCVYAAETDLNRGG